MVLLHTAKHFKVRRLLFKFLVYSCNKQLCAMRKFKRTSARRISFADRRSVSPLQEELNNVEY